MNKRSLVRLAVLAGLLALAAITGMAAAQTVPDLQNWTVQIQASAAGVTPDTDNVFGVAPNALDGWKLDEDILDVLPAPGTFLHLSFYHASSEPGWTNHGGYYKSDIRAPLQISETKVWNVRLRANLGTSTAPVQFTLSWGDLSALPSDLSFTLQEVSSTGAPIGAPVNMRQQTSITGEFATNGSVATRIFNVIVTDLRVGEPVTLSDVTVASVTATSVALAFTTDPAATATVQYGPTTAYGSTVVETAPATSHLVEVTGLNPSTEYHFKVRVSAPGRAVAESPDILATTLGLLTISNLSATEISSKAATINWTTNVAASASVRYGLSPAELGAPMTVPGVSTEHSATLTGLQPNTSYVVEVESTAPGYAPAKAQLTFQTLPAISITSGPTVANITGTSAVVSWTTDVAGSSVVEYGVGESLTQSAGDPNASETTHTVALSGLTPGTTYSFRVVTQAAGFDSAVSQVSTFSTLAPVAATTPVVSGLQPTNARISFTTDVPAVATLEYGVGGVLDKTQTETTPSTSHVFELTGLTPKTKYDYRITASAEGKADAVLSGLSFTTPEFQAIELVEGPTVTPGATTAVIRWTTDVPAVGTVEVGPTTDYGITVAEEAATTDHSVTVTGLQKDTLYHFRVRATAEGFTPLVTEDATFRTLAFGFIESPVAKDITGTSAVIAFKTAVESTATVEYGTTDQYGKKVEVTTPATEFNVELTNLTPGTTYHYKVVIKAGEETMESADALFATLNRVEFTFMPRIVDITRTSAVVAFVTDVEAIGEVLYGGTTAYGAVKSDVAPVIQHRILITGLNPGTLYHLKVRITAEGRDANETGDMTFATLPAAMPGDIDGDGVVTERDALLILRHVVGLIELSPSQIAMADVAPRGRPDGRLTAADVVLVLRAAARIETLPTPPPKPHDQGAGGSE